MYVFYFYTVELIFCFKVKTKKVVAWELFYCVLHFLFFLYNILIFFFHLRIENKNQFRDILLHKTLCSNPLFWSSILINVSVRVCGLHSCVVCRELGWRHLCRSIPWNIRVYRGRECRQKSELLQPQRDTHPWIQILLLPWLLWSMPRWR